MEVSECHEKKSRLNADDIAKSLWSWQKTEITYFEK